MNFGSNFIVDSNQENISLWNNSNRFSLSNIYLKTKHKEKDQLSILDTSVFRRCLRGNHAICKGFLATDDYKSYCTCPCHSIVEGLDGHSMYSVNKSINSRRRKI